MPGSAESLGAGFPTQTSNRGKHLSCLLCFPSPGLLKIPVWEAIPCHLAIFNRAGRAHLALPRRHGTVADIPSLRLTPALPIIPTHSIRAVARRFPGVAGEGGGDRPRGSRAPRDPARRLPPSLDLPSLPHLGSRKPETLARRGPKQVVALGGLPRAGAREGIQFPLLRPSESRVASGGSAAAVASSPAAGAAARPSPPPAPPARARGRGAQGVRGPRRARAGSREGFAIRSEG